MRKDERGGPTFNANPHLFASTMRDETSASRFDQTTATPALRLEQICKSFRNQRILIDVSLTVSTGDVLAIIGPSGAGKSTLLRCINYLEPLTSGCVYLNEQLVGLMERRGKLAASSNRELTKLRRSIGMVFQSFNLFPHLTALGNIALGQIHTLGRSPQDARTRGQELLTRVELAGKGKSYSAQLSGGEQQRVAIVRALALDPQVMLFNEPTSAIDPELRIEVLGVMRRAWSTPQSGSPRRCRRRRKDGMRVRWGAIDGHGHGVLLMGLKVRGRGWHGPGRGHRLCS